LNYLDYINSNKERYLDELKQFLSIPSVSTDPKHKHDVRACAEFVEKKLTEAGLENVKVYETGGHPLVYGDWLYAGDDKPTVLIYGHYDVQPVDPLELWNAPPFSPTIKGDKIFARGASDDKGQVFIHVKSIESYLKTKGNLPINVKIIVEGEEEIGSDHLDSFIESNKSLLGCDFVLVSDTAMYQPGLPAICYGLRGLVYMEVNVTGPNRDLHSGAFGGAVDNPANALAHIISRLKDLNGEILIPGFYDDVKELTDDEREEFRKLPFNEEKFKDDLGVEDVFGEKGYTTLERKSARPTLDVNGIWGGFQGEGAKTVLPSKAGAKISMRLVPDQEPDKIQNLFTDYIKSIAAKSVKVEISGTHNAKPAITPIDSDEINAAKVALKRSFGVEPVFIREGGSIPVVNTFQELLNAPTILIGFGLNDENIHSPNEHFDLNNFYKGIESISFYFEELGKLNYSNK